MHVRNINKIFAFALFAAFAFCILCVFSTGAYALSSVQVQLTVGQAFSYKNGNKPTAGDSFDYRLSAIDAEYPMPDNAVDGILDFTLSGKNAVTSLALRYDHAGIYKYKLEHILEKKLVGYTYDMSVYEVDVYVTNDSSNGLKASVVIIDDDGKKPDSIVYCHSYIAGGGNPRTGDRYNIASLCAISYISMLLSITAFIYFRKDTTSN